MRHFMGEEDVRRQKLNVFRMELLGAKVESVAAGSGTLKDAVNEALRYWFHMCMIRTTLWDLFSDHIHSRKLSVISKV